MFYAGLIYYPFNPSLFLDLFRAHGQDLVEMNQFFKSDFLFKCKSCNVVVKQNLGIFLIDRILFVKKFLVENQGIPRNPQIDLFAKLAESRNQLHYFFYGCLDKWMPIGIGGNTLAAYGQFENKIRQEPGVQGECTIFLVFSVHLKENPSGLKILSTYLIGRFPK